MSIQVCEQCDSNYAIEGEMLCSQCHEDYSVIMEIAANSSSEQVMEDLESGKLDKCEFCDAPAIKHSEHGSLDVCGSEDCDTQAWNIYQEVKTW